MIPFDEAKARIAFDVMMRRGWVARKYPEGWGVAEAAYYKGLQGVHAGLFWPDPFTALVEAEKWHRENV